MYFEQRYTNGEMSDSRFHEVSLSGLCINCIAENFERFLSAYLYSQDDFLKANFKILKKEYTPAITQVFLETDLTKPRVAYVKDAYLDILINEYSKKLNVRRFMIYGASWEAIIKRVSVVGGHGFTKFSLGLLDSFQVSRNTVLKDMNQAVCWLKNVEVLSLYENCNDEILENISRYCTKLSELNISHSHNVTKKGFKMLCKKHDEFKIGCQLKKIFAPGIKLSKSTISFLLTNMPSLNILKCDNLPCKLYSLHKNDFKNNVRKYNLTALDFETQLFYGNTTLEENILRVWSEMCPKIEVICMNIQTENQLALISRFSNLEDISLECRYNPGIELNNFIKLSGATLKRLNIEDFSFSVSTLIASCPKLEWLFLRNVQFQSLEDSKKHIYTLRHIRVEDLPFSDQYVEESITKLMINSPNVNEIYFKRCSFKNLKRNAKLATKSCNSLEFFRCNDIEVDLLKSVIVSCSSLTCLKINDCRSVTPDSAIELRKFRDAIGSSLKIEYCRDILGEEIDEEYELMFFDNEESDDNLEFEGAEFEEADDEPYTHIHRLYNA